MYTQFAIQDSGLFGPNPWKFLAQIVYVFPWSPTQPLEQILDSELLLCELGVLYSQLFNVSFQDLDVSYGRFP